VFRISSVCSAIAAALSILAAASCASSTETGATVANDLAVQVRFTTKWWSATQMEGLDPNNPPPKNTEVELARWEYSDPVGVPHPDVVDVLVTVENRNTVPVSALAVTAQGEWKIGPIGNESSANWGEPVVLRKADGVQVAGKSTQVIRMPVNLKQMMDSLEGKNEWPYMLRVGVTVSQTGRTESLASTQIDFPIRPGD
jgi:hypothetical protein